MTKLEPTRTSSDLTATERLRRLLDERGVEWDYGITGATTTRFDVNGTDLTFTPMRDGLVCSTILTPEQAIAATLGREPDDAAMAKLHDQMNAAMLKYEMAQGIEKRDEDGAIVVPWVLKMHALLEEAATLGSCNCLNNCTNSERTGTCTADETEHIECGTIDGRHYDIHVMECTECGHVYEHVNGDYEYCPRCGRRVVEVDG